MTTDNFGLSANLTGQIAMVTGASQGLGEAIAIIRDCHDRHICPGPVETDGTMVKVARSLGIYVGDPATLPSLANTMN